MPNKPRSIFMFLIKWYFGIGFIFALIMWWSYMWPITWGSVSSLSNTSFWERRTLYASVQPIAIYSSAVRLVLWGPSLALWIGADNLNYSFVQWLAPGLGIQKITID